MSKTKEKQRPLIHDIGKYEGQWRNVAFDNRGRSHRGTLIHPSKEIAQVYITVLEAKFEEGLADSVETLERDIPCWEYSHSIPMPMGGDDE